MNTLKSLLNSDNEKENDEVKENNKPEIKETYIERKVIKHRERKENKLDDDYKELSQLKNKTGIKILAFTAPFLGTIMGVFWSLFSIGVNKEYLKIITGLLISTAVGNIIGGIVSLKITNDELQATELDMYKGMKNKHLIEKFKSENTQKENDELKSKYDKLYAETSQIRKENEDRKLKEEVDRQLKIKEKELNDRVEQELEKRVKIEISKRKKDKLNDKLNDK